MTEPEGSRARRDPDALLARAGVRGDRNQDQHFLVDDRVLDRLPEYATAFDTSHVLEVGAGTGGLTDRLLADAERVTAVERDVRLVEFLREEFAGAVDAGRLDVVAGDALDVDLPEFSASVSNLPYGSSSELLFRLLPRERPLVVMVQAEFAERMVADPGSSEYGRLSVTAGHYADAEIVERVPREAFSPPPAVESAVVRTTPRDPDYDVPEDAFFAFVRGVFTQRRKTMRNAIRNTTHITGIADAAAVVAAADEDLLASRAGELRPQEFAALTTLAIEDGGLAV
ncbi:16S ribosomal RNA methyltransferase A [Halococcus hamelinensis]|uniref:Probable ribosomal RNA small subunit methyltransferase A n=1 Tax=Halococcus hamelinensis 100A6 TaxID=1132509 RepID=M0M3A2_9EURY|nr:16S ribosomal RNA methyltransferase A [Halococcus hamelinensis]EMA38860.1 16S ribosomal RNA methyltransferase KsgA/Dim1 family protein [Halococcus hamelinensis 100A6]